MTIDFKNKTKYVIRKKCVLCGSSKLTEVLNFKKVFSSFKVFAKLDGPIINTFSLCI